MTNNKTKYIPACVVNFVPSQVEVFVRKYFGNFPKEFCQKLPGGIQGGVDGPKCARDE